MKRPVGVIILALFYLLGAVLFLVVLMVPILRPASVAALHTSNLGQDIQHAQTYKGVHTLLILIFAGIGLGLWFLQSWARRIVLLIAGVHLARQIIVVLSSAVHPAAFQQSWGYFWFSTSLSAAMVVYLLQPQVKRAFAKP